jgi:F-type H+-transporting ATPase subunit alpha
MNTDGRGLPPRTAGIDEAATSPDSGSVGIIVQAGDGLVRVDGLADCMAGEVIEVAPGHYAVALDLEEHTVACALLDRVPGLRPGDRVRGTGRLPSMPCGPGLFGRVIDPLGRPRDGGGPVTAETTWPLDFPAAGLAERQPVQAALQTGVKAVDALVRVGRGQCRPVLGGRRSGKTALAQDAIVAQKDSGVLCVYVAVGQREAAVAEVVATLRRTGALAHTAIVVAGSADPPALRHFAPFAGCALAESFTYGQGRDTLVVFDDLTRHALAHAELSALLRHTPGPDLTPADRRWVLARLLERAVARIERWVIVPANAGAEDAVNGVVYCGPLEKATAEYTDLPRHPGCRLARVAGSGGSLTVLPVVETDDDAADALARDVVALGDGPLWLRAELFQAGVYPALDLDAILATHSGGPAVPASKYLHKRLTLEYVAMRELEAFAALGTELDRASRAQLERGYRVAEALRQPAGRPLPPPDQVLILYAAVAGFLDHVPLAQVRAFEEGLIAYTHVTHPQVLKSLDRPRLSCDDLCGTLDPVIADFQRRFMPGTP